ncbi:MAG: hypothetical protein ACFFAU_01025 [Candidatus Hodarchaeota archaeon]
MKLKQREYCHNCNQYVTYEFEDITERQIIICPNCGHQHYRELDEGTIVNIRMNPQSTEIRMQSLPEPILFNSNLSNSVADMSIPLETKTFKIIGHTEDGRPIIEKTDEDFNHKGKNTKSISQRRWGRDPRQ